MIARTQGRPLRGLIQALIRLPANGDGSVDFRFADPELLDTASEDAATAIAVITLGLGAIGHLLANSADAIDDGTIHADCLESLGYLIAELGDLAGACLSIDAHCRTKCKDVSK